MTAHILVYVLSISTRLELYVWCTHVQCEPCILGRLEFTPSVCEQDFKYFFKVKNQNGKVVKEVVLF